MHFCQLQKAHDDPVLALAGTPIPVNEENKVLGVIFDSKLLFIPHIKQLNAKCQKNVEPTTDRGADRHVLIKLHRIIIRPKLTMAL